MPIHIQKIESTVTDYTLVPTDNEDVIVFLSDEDITVRFQGDIFEGFSCILVPRGLGTITLVAEGDGEIVGVLSPTVAPLESYFAIYSEEDGKVRTKILGGGVGDITLEDLLLIEERIIAYIDGGRPKLYCELFNLTGDNIITESVLQKVSIETSENEHESVSVTPNGIILSEAGEYRFDVQAQVELGKDKEEWDFWLLRGIDPPPLDVTDSVDGSLFRFTGADQATTMTFHFEISVSQQETVEFVQACTKSGSNVGLVGFSGIVAGSPSAIPLHIEVYKLN